jgi:negative regulator of sigma E activity
VRQPIPSFYCVLDENARYDELYDLIKVPEKKVAGRLTCTKTNLGSSCSLSD